MKKILVLLLVSFAFLHNTAEGASMRILGTPYSVSILALSEQGTVTGKWWTKVYGPLEKVWISADRGKGRIQTTRPGKDVVFSSLVFWNFKETQYPKLPLGDGEIHMNNSEILVVQHDLSAIVEKVYDDGNVKKRYPDAEPETVVLYPDGTHKKITLLSKKDKVSYFDDNGDIVFKSSEDKDLYYSLNVHDKSESLHADLALEDLESIRSYHQTRFSTLEGKTIPDNASLEREINTYFYSVATTPPIPPHLSEQTNENPGWHIEKILLANQQGQLVAKAKYTKKNYYGTETFMGQEIRGGGSYYIYIDLK